MRSIIALLVFSIVHATPAKACLDTDNGATDSYGVASCAQFSLNTQWCGKYDDSDFSSNTMCCACGGGQAVYTCATGTGTACATCVALSSRNANDHCDTCNPGYEISFMSTGSAICQAHTCTTGTGTACATCVALASRTTNAHCDTCNPGYEIDETICKAHTCTTGTGSACATCVALASRTTNAHCDTCNPGYEADETICKAHCTKPSTTGYDLTACASTILQADWNPACGSCSVGYTGAVSHTSCNWAGAAWSVSGCQTTTTTITTTTRTNTTTVTTSALVCPAGNQGRGGTCDCEGAPGWNSTWFAPSCVEGECFSTVLHSQCSVAADGFSLGDGTQCWGGNRITRCRFQEALVCAAGNQGPGGTCDCEGAPGWNSTWFAPSCLEGACYFSVLHSQCSVAADGFSLEDGTFCWGGNRVTQCVAKSWEMVHNTSQGRLSCPHLNGNDYGLGTNCPTYADAQACQEVCLSAVGGCNAINFKPSTRECCFKECVDPNNPIFHSDTGYEVYIYRVAQVAQATTTTTNTATTTTIYYEVSSLDLTITDPTLTGFERGFADGTYGYVVPYNNGTHFHGKIARFAFSDFSTVAVLDLAITDPTLKGFRGGFTDGMYGYVVPYGQEPVSFLGKIARFSLDDFSSVAVLDLAITDPTLKGFRCGFSDGTYGYAVPFQNQNGGFFGKLVRFALDDFSTVAVLDLTITDPSLKGFHDGFTWGPGGFLVPMASSDGFHGKIAGFALDDFSSVLVLDLTITDPSLKGFACGFTDGTFGYVVPYHNGVALFGKIGRFAFSDFSNTAVLDLAITDPSLKGFGGGFTDGTYGYVVPYTNNGGQFGKIGRFVLNDFSTVAVLDLAITDPSLIGFSGGFTDGTYGYVVPSSGKIGRITVSQVNAFCTLPTIASGAQSWRGVNCGSGSTTVVVGTRCDITAMSGYSCTSPGLCMAGSTFENTASCSQAETCPTGYSLNHTGYWMGYREPISTGESAASCAQRCDADNACVAFAFGAGKCALNNDPLGVEMSMAGFVACKQAPLVPVKETDCNVESVSSMLVKLDPAAAPWDPPNHFGNPGQFNPSAGYVSMAYYRNTFYSGTCNAVQWYAADTRHNLSFGSCQCLSQWGEVLYQLQAGSILSSTSTFISTSAPSKSISSSQTHILFASVDSTTIGTSSIATSTPSTSILSSQNGILSSTSTIGSNIIATSMASTSILSSQNGILSSTSTIGSNIIAISTPSTSKSSLQNDDSILIGVSTTMSTDMSSVLYTMTTTNSPTTSTIAATTTTEIVATSITTTAITSMTIAMVTTIATAALTTDIVTTTATAAMTTAIVATTARVDSCEILPDVALPASLEIGCAGRPNGSLCSIICPSGVEGSYSNVGMPYYICKDGHYQRPPTDFCAPDSCDYPPLLIHGDAHTECKGQAHGTSCSIRCAHGYEKPKQLDSVVCRAGSWQIPGSCIPRNTSSIQGIAVMMSLLVDVQYDLTVSGAIPSMFEWAREKEDLLLSALASSMNTRASSLQIELGRSFDAGRRLSDGDLHILIAHVLPINHLESGRAKEDLIDDIVKKLVGNRSTVDLHDRGAFLNGRTDRVGFPDSLFSLLRAEGTSISHPVFSMRVALASKPTFLENYTYYLRPSVILDLEGPLGNVSEHTTGESQMLLLVVVASSVCLCIGCMMLCFSLGRKRRRPGEDSENKMDYVIKMPGKNDTSGSWQLGKMPNKDDTLGSWSVFNFIRSARTSLAVSNNGEKIRDSRLSHGNVEDGRVHVIWDIDQAFTAWSHSPRKSRQHGSEVSTACRSEGATGCRSEVSIAFRSEVSTECRSSKELQERTPRRNSFAQQLRRLSGQGMQLFGKSDSGKFSKFEDEACAVQDSEYLNADLCRSPIEYDPLAVRPFVNDGECMEYFSVTAKRWLRAKMKVEVNMNRPDIEYTAIVNSTFSRSGVLLDQLRRPFAVGDLVEVFSQRNGGTWLAGVIHGVQNKAVSIVGYQVRLLETGGVLANIPATRLRFHYPPGQRILVYKNCSEGWIDASVADSAPSDGIENQMSRLSLPSKSLPSNNNMGDCLEQESMHRQEPSFQNFVSQCRGGKPIEASPLENFEEAQEMDMQDTGQLPEKQTPDQALPAMTTARQADLRNSDLELDYWVWVPVMYNTREGVHSPRIAEIPSYRIRPQSKWADDAERTRFVI